MALINQNSIIGVTSITSPSASNVLTVHTNDTTERLRVSTTGLSFSGTSASLDTSGNLTVSGNVSIGGTLTYEDVTNIDAVGIITANAGIHLDDVLSHKGNTNTKIRFPTADTITAETAGSERLRIRNDGRVQVKSGSAEIIAGEGASAQLRLTADEGDDGSDYWRFESNHSTNKLNIATYAGGAWVDKVTITSSGNLTIPGDASVKDIFYGDGSTTGYFRSITNVNRANAAAAIHLQQFKWNDTKVAEIKVITGDDTTNKDNAHITFETASAGTTAERLRIDSSGRVLISDAATAGPMETFGSAVLQVATTAGGTLVLGRNDSSVSTDNGIGSIYFDVNDSTGNAWNETARITVNADGDHANNDYPSRMEFYTTGDGEATPTERLRITSSGYLKHTGLRSGNSQNKLAILTTPSYNTSEEDVALYIAENESGSNQITFGGGTSVYNAATNIRFLTASAVNTTTGSERLRIDNVGSAQFTGQDSPSGRNTRISRYGSVLVATTGELISNARCSIDSGNGNITTEGGMQASSVNLQSSSTSSWFQTGTNIASYPYVWAAKNSSSNTWHSGLQTDGDLYLGGNLAGTNNIALNGSNGSAWFSGSVAIGGNAAANTIDEYEEGTWTPVMNKSGVGGTAGTPSTGVGYYRRVGQLLWISFYWYKGSGGFGNNAGEWYVSGLPFLLAHGSGSGYQFIPGGYNNINGTNYQTQSNRWQSNNTNGSATLAMYGPNATTNWTSGYAEFSASGCLMLP